jgi:hypothetical protein
MYVKPYLIGDYYNVDAIFYGTIQGGVKNPLACSMLSQLTPQLDSQELKARKKTQMKDILTSIDAFNNNLNQGKRLIRELQHNVVRLRMIVV